MMINLALGIILGLGLGMVVVFTKEFLDVRIHSPEDIKRLKRILEKNEEEE